MNAETIQCTGCKKRFFADGFKVNRLRQRLKTCLECNARNVGRQKHGQNMRRKAFEVINIEALKQGWICLDAYTNAQTPVEWECTTCSRICKAKWKTLYADMKFECPGTVHKFPDLLPVWRKFAESRGLDPKRDMKNPLFVDLLVYKKLNEAPTPSISPLNGPTISLTNME